MDRLNLHPDALPQEMHVLTAEDRDIAGPDAVIFLGRQISWAWPVVALAQLPSVHKLLDRGYRWIAAHRRCRDIACGISEQPLVSGPVMTTTGPRRSGDWRQAFLEVLPAWILLIGLPISVLPLRHRLVPWQFMWLMAAAIFFGCKWLTAWRALTPDADLKLGRALGYFFAWPGMDAKKFLTPEPSDPKLDCFKQSSFTVSRPRVWTAVGKMLFGTGLLFGVAPIAHRPLLAGWIGMIGMILILHFGLFQLLALGWRKVGIDVKPIMNAPLRSKSLGEFWGRRWNSAFNRLAFEFVSRPLARRMGGRRSGDNAPRSGRSPALRFGTAVATLLAFFVSGLIHEMVISLPARAGYGLPTAYFLFQAIGILLERAPPKICGRVFTILITVLPAFWLFHPPFVRHVILPFMQAMGAL